MSINQYNKLIIGLSGLALTEDEIDFIQTYKPMGFILFSRNIQDKNQVRKFTSELRAISSYLIEEPWILIDQEGGRVNRLRDLTDDFDVNAGYFGLLAEKYGMDYAIEKTNDYYSQIGKFLSELGINTNCAPVLDLRHNFPGEHVIGERSFSDKTDIVVALARVAIKALERQNIRVIAKHIPGHGCAALDSHEYLPIVEKPIAELVQQDFKIFRQLADSYGIAMTAHVIYNALDASYPATLSKKVISYIREHINKDLCIITDDLSMGALSNQTLNERAKIALQAGCDILLHCNGDIGEMYEIAKVFQ